MRMVYVGAGDTWMGNGTGRHGGSPTGRDYPELRKYPRVPADTQGTVQVTAGSPTGREEVILDHNTLPFEWVNVSVCKVNAHPE